MAGIIKTILTLGYNQMKKKAESQRGIIRICNQLGCDIWVAVSVEIEPRNAMASEGMWCVHPTQVESWSRYSPCRVKIVIKDKKKVIELSPFPVYPGGDGQMVIVNQAFVDDAAEFTRAYKAGDEETGYDCMPSHMKNAPADCGAWECSGFEPI